MIRSTWRRYTYRHRHLRRASRSQRPARTLAVGLDWAPFAGVLAIVLGYGLWAAFRLSGAL